jgi:type IV secretory pathway VirB10-like protein
MHRPILTCAFFVLATAAFAQQQQPNPSDPYQGQSNPPADDIIVTQPDQPAPKPHAGKHMAQPQPSAPTAPTAAGAPTATVTVTAASPTQLGSDPDVNGTDDGIVGIARPEAQPQTQPQPQSYSASASADTQPALRSRAADPDGDIVRPLAPGQLAYGTTIRVRLLTSLSSNKTQQGEIFRTRVASDVVQDGQVLIPAGSEIAGRVTQVSAGTMRSHGSILLRPDTVTLPDGSRYRLEAQVTGTPGSKNRVNHEGFIDPPSRLKKDAILYGAAVGTGAGVGAVLGGGVGAVTGGAIGAGVITLHILSSHSETNLEPGTVLLLTLNSRLDLQVAQANPTGN